ncbi:MULTISPECIES: hypothetical protein [unclassified Streptomyces]|uniref:hypothetical protein n=1 Tax=unclassified Streptomyces TaxID=2593676 RepID=UPI0036654DC4
MPETVVRGRPATMAFVVLGVCLALVGGIAVWLLIGRDTAVPCNGLLKDKRVRQSLGSALTPSPSCAGLGEAIQRATVGEVPGRHSLAQAQTMKSVLLALGFPDGKSLRLDPALRRPLATALADYAADTHTMLHSLDGEYAMKDGTEAAPWESPDGFRLAVYQSTLQHVLRAVSEDPAAYATLRIAETRYAAQELAAVPGGATGANFSMPAVRNSKALGTFDAIASAVTRDIGKNKSQWESAVSSHLVATPPSTAASHDSAAITAEWLNGLRTAPEQERMARLRTQAVDMTRTWAQERNVDAAPLTALLTQVEERGGSAYRDALNELTGS